MPGARRQAATRGRTRRRVRKNIAIGQAHIKTSFNNTIVSLTDREGNVILAPPYGEGAWGALAALQDVGFVESVRGAAPDGADRKSTRLNSSHLKLSRMPSSA